MKKLSPVRVVPRQWHLLSAAREPLGRLAVKVANFLTGKGKVSYRPNLDAGDYVVIVEAKGLVTSGKKDVSKVYYRYSGYPGGLKRETLGSLRVRKPEEVIRHAVFGMLAKNKLARPRMARLFIYDGTDQPHKAQVNETEN